MHYLIDGHNLIGRVPGLRLDDPDDEAKLIEQLHVYAQRIRKKMTVIFDPALYQALPTSSPFADVKAVWAKRGSSADDVIVQRVQKARRPREIVVVTGDQALAGRVRAAGAQVLAPEAFLARMNPPHESEEAIPDAGEMPDLHLSADEVEMWMELFRERRRDKNGGHRRKE